MPPQQEQDQTQKKWPPGWLLALLGLLIILVAVFSVAMAGAALFARLTSRGEPVSNVEGGTAGGNGGTSAGKVDCSGVAMVPKNLMADVKDASGKYLGGDEAALIAIIQTESSWNVRASNPSSSAAGLGQFLTSTARGYEEYNGGKDPTGKNWPTGVLYESPRDHPDDARFGLDGQRAVYATAHMFGRLVQRYNGDIREAYERGYHTYANEAQERDAKAGGARLMRVYNEIMANGCKSSNDDTVEDHNNDAPTGSYLKVPYVQEKTQGDCGQASVLMVALYYEPSLKDPRYLEKAPNGKWQTRDNIGCVTPVYLNNKIKDSSKHGWIWANPSHDQGVEMIKRSIAGGDPVVFYGAPGLIFSGQHIFVITGYDAATRTFWVNNPNIGSCECDPSTKTPNGKQMTEERIKQYFGQERGTYSHSLMIRGKYR